uniref:Uncharacterized protein n=1 Tax=Parascaris equorum TaxID=6256 RepID=A0A914S4F9_PAREQ
MAHFVCIREMCFAEIALAIHEIAFAVPTFAHIRMLLKAAQAIPVKSLNYLEVEFYALDAGRFALPNAVCTNNRSSKAVLTGEALVCFLQCFNLQTFI